MTAYGDVDLGVLGDPTRRAIFELLARRPCSVGELAEHLPITPQAVSQHLRVLRDGGLVVATPEGTRRIYRLNPDRVAAFAAYFQRISASLVKNMRVGLPCSAAQPQRGMRQ